MADFVGDQSSCMVEWWRRVRGGFVTNRLESCLIHACGSSSYVTVCLSSSSRSLRYDFPGVDRRYSKLDVGGSVEGYRRNGGLLRPLIHNVNILKPIIERFRAQGLCWGRRRTPR